MRREDCRFCQQYTETDRKCPLDEVDTFIINNSLTIQPTIDPIRGTVYLTKDGGSMYFGICPEAATDLPEPFQVKHNILLIGVVGRKRLIELLPQIGMDAQESKELFKKIDGLGVFRW